MKKMGTLSDELRSQFPPLCIDATRRPRARHKRIESTRFDRIDHSPNADAGYYKGSTSKT